MRAFWERPWGEQPGFGEPPRPALPQQAQAQINFPLLLPDPSALPEGMSPGDLTVRPESDAAHSTVRMVLEGGGRRLRIKSYFFDWWRPTELTQPLARVHGFYRVEGGIVAWGRDGRGRYLSVLGRGRATIEVAILQGTFVELELRRLMGGFAAVVPSLAERFAGTPFPLLSYHIRRGRGPGGLDELAAASWTRTPEEIAARATSPLLVPPTGSRPGWTFDGGARWESPPPDECQWLYRDSQGAVVLYGRARPTADSQPLKLPATYRSQEGWRARQTMVRRRRATVAAQHPDLGGYSAAWAESGHRYQIFVRPGALPGMRSFLDLINHLVPVEGSAH